jgi:hypothetical protein
VSRPQVRIVRAYRAAHKAALAAGWTVTLTGGGHLRWQPPTGGPVFTPESPSSWRGTRKDLGRLRSRGLDVRGGHV